MAFDDSFLDRTAGFRRFIEGQQPPTQRIAEKSPINKFLDFATEAFTPGHVQQNEASAIPAPVSAPVEADDPFRETALGGIAEMFIPGVRGVFKGQRQQQRSQAIREFAKTLPDDPVEQIRKLMEVDPANAGKYVPALLEADKLKRAVPKQTENQRQVDILMSRGISRIDAENIANGFVEPVTNPITNQTELVDLTTGETKPLSVAKDTTPTTDEIIDPLQKLEPTKVPSLFERAPLSTGVVSAAKDVFSGTLGQIPGVPIAEQTIQARQDLKTAQQDLVRSLITGDRFTATEMNAIKDEIEIESSIFESPKSLQQKMISIDRSLRRRLKDQENTANNASLPAKDRQGALSNANSIKNFLNTLAVPTTVKTPEEARKLPSGSTFIDPSGKIRRVP